MCGVFVIALEPGAQRLFLDRDADAAEVDQDESEYDADWWETQRWWKQTPVRRRAFAIKPCRTGSGTAVRRAGACLAEVRGSNPLSSTRKSAQIDVISYGTG